MQNTPTQAYTGYIYKVKTLHMILLGLVIYLSVLVVNDGFMALDEYWVGITRYIPAQSSSLMALVAVDDVKSPLQLLPMHAVAQMALYFGVNSPYAQYRIVIFVLGLISTLLLLFAFYKFAAAQKLNQYQTNLLFLVLFFHFAAPFALTRPMFESVAAPWLALAGVFAYKYDISNKLKDLVWGVFFASIAFVLRQQLGFCALVFIILPIMKKNMIHALVAATVGLLFFILSGIPDVFIRGGFHYSLINLTTYNYQHGAEYGNRSILFYPVLIFVVAFVPFFLKKYEGFDFKTYLLKNRSLIIIIFLFVFLHSLFPQKWERFVISVIPILMFLGFPFLYELCKNSKNNKKRLFLLFLFNGLLFVVASFFPAQKNLIEMSRYLNINSQIKKVYRVADTPGWITEAFILNKNFIFVDSDKNQLLDIDWNDCSKNLVVGEAQADYLKDVTAGLKLVTEFNVNLIEQLAFKMNPKNNLRRVQLKLYSGCGG